MIRKIAGTFSTKLIGAFLNLAIVILTTRFLGVTGKGETSLIITNISLILLLNHFVGGTALVYLAPRIKTILLLIPSYIWALISCSIGTSILYFFGQIESGIAIHIFFLSLILSIFSIHQMLLMGKEKIGWHNILSLSQIAITVIILVYFFIIKEQKDIDSFIFSIYGAYGFSLMSKKIPSPVLFILHKGK